MRVEKCKWKYGKQAPFVILMDDLANKYMTDKDNGNYIGADWGGRCKRANSWYEFVQNHIFQKYPYVKMTCFLVTGRREDFIKNGKQNVTLPINANEEFKNFLRELTQDERIELAYHGYTHGKIAEEGFIQEWRMYSNLQEALEWIEKGKHLYREVTGKEFKGGKYCGYESNHFSEESIIRGGFGYWCRHWDANVFKGQGTGAESLEMDFFENVVDIPSTVDSNLCSLKQVGSMFSRKYIKALYYLLKHHVTLEAIIDSLASKGQVISVQSHTSPMREDDKRQFPNVVDDIKNIQYILEYVKKYDLWYATCEEISEYFRVYSAVEICCNHDAIIVTVKEKLPENIKENNIYIKIYGLDADCHWYLQGEKEKVSMSMGEGYCLARIPIVKTKKKYLIARG